MSETYQTIKDRIKADEFETKLPFPRDEELEKHEKYQKLTKEILQLQARIQVLKSNMSILVSDMKWAWDKDQATLKTKFKEALEEAYGLQNHPKKNEIWQKAWDDGHSGGLTEVLNEYDEIAELVR